MAIFVLMSLCSYIIYTGMEDESEEDSGEVTEDTLFVKKREIAIPEVDNEKDN